MDSHIDPGQPGRSTDSSDGEERANYFRRPKGEAAQGAPADADTKGDSKAPVDANSPKWKELRQSPRLRCSGSVEFQAEGSDVRLWGTITDVSLHGCYVEMNNTFPIDTKVDLVIKSFGIRIQTAGTVRTSHPFLGMGICFKDIEPTQQLHLKQLLSVLAGRSAVSNGVSTPENGVKDTPPSASPRAILAEITEFFQKNHVLSRDEFHQIANRVRRP